MSKQHPVVAVTGSSGAGTTTVKRAFEHIFTREGINAAVVEGDSFHRYDRAEMKAKVAEEHLSHFGPEANRFDKLEELFRTYGETGTGEKRYYLHNIDEAADHNNRLGTDKKAGEFTPWEPIPEGTDLLFYEGLHGLITCDDCDVAQHVDLGIGVEDPSRQCRAWLLARGRGRHDHAPHAGLHHPHHAAVLAHRHQLPACLAGRHL
jgi:phosphoribulokinase